jgi:hypothetical protein
MKKKSDEARLGAVLSFRTPQRVKETLLKEAAGEGKRLGDYLFELLNLGREALWAEKKAEKEETKAAERSEKPRIPKTVKPQRQEDGDPTVQPKKPESPGSTEAVDEVFLAGIKERFPSLNFSRLMARLNETSKTTGKKITRNTVERLFEIAAGQAGKG